MNDAIETKQASSHGSSGTSSEQLQLRVVLVSDAESLRCYGPVLRRLFVGLIDEVNDLTLMCLGASGLLEHVPSPPVRLINELRGYGQAVPHVDTLVRQVRITSQRLAFVDRLFPHLQVSRLAHSLSPYKPTLLHALSERQGSLVRRLSKQMAIPYVVSLLSMNKLDVSFSRTRCAGIFCCNSSLARLSRHQKGIPPSCVRVLPIGTHVISEPSCFRGNEKVAKIFCCSELKYGRGLSELINVIKRIVKIGHNVVLIISGSGPAERDLRRQVQCLNLVANVHFVPPIEHILSTNDAYKEVLKDVDIYVQPWPAKTWQPALLEAMSVGNAVLATDATNNDLIIANKTAINVPFRDEQSMADGFVKLITDHSFARGLATAGQAHLRKHFLSSKMIARLARAYRQALSIDKNRLR